MNENAVAVDFESPYGITLPDGTLYDLKTLGVHRYVDHEAFVPYLVSFFGTDKDGRYIRHVGPPREAPWGRLAGCTLLAHNSEFDGYAYHRLQHDDPDIYCPTGNPTDYDNWVCTADLACYLGAERSLKDATRALLGREISKAVRASAAGLTGEEVRQQEWWPQMLRYCIMDSIYSYFIYAHHGHKWPEHERALSKLTKAKAIGGLNFDKIQFMKELLIIRGKVTEALSNIPWVGEVNPKTKKPWGPLAKTPLKEYCDSKDIELPASLAMTNPVANAWFEEYKDDKAIGSIRNYRRMNKLRCVYDSVNNKMREDGSVATTLKYFGAHTGRWSGGEGNDKGEPSSLNWQNLPKKPLFDTDLRKCIMAPPGHVLGVVDLSQIEPRALAWVVDDQEFLDLVRQGISIYEAHARLTMNYIEDSPLNEFDPDWYSLAKARVLALGYGAGWKKFQAMAHGWGIEIDDETAKSTVRQFRQSNEKIMNFHEFLDTKLYNNIGGSFTMTLPTGRDMVYNNIRGTDVFKWGRVCTEIYCNRGFSKKNVLVYGGLLVENYVQALAREVFAKALLNLHAAGYDVRVHVHDEAVAVLPIRTAEQDLQAIIDIMSVTPDWLPGCPIACEGHITERYVKK